MTFEFQSPGISEASCAGRSTGADARLALTVPETEIVVVFVREVHTQCSLPTDLCAVGGVGRPELPYSSLMRRSLKRSLSSWNEWICSPMTPLVPTPCCLCNSSSNTPEPS